MSPVKTSLKFFVYSVHAEHLSAPRPGHMKVGNFCLSCPGMIRASITEHCSRDAARRAVSAFFPITGSADSRRTEDRWHKNSSCSWNRTPACNLL